LFLFQQKNIIFVDQEFRNARRWRKEHSSYFFVLGYRRCEVFTPAGAQEVFVE
jgi:hypothetical protein